jgi:MerR family mercuric resistance operon transcriptional regulator
MSSMTMNRLTIGQVARQAEIGVETVRFYERQGLVEEPPRRESGYREYAPEVVKRLLFIRRAKELGFTLNEIKELLSFDSCPDVKTLAQAKIADIAAKIKTLKRMQRVLSRLVSECTSDTECPILEALEGQENCECVPTAKRRAKR